MINKMTADTDWNECKITDFMSRPETTQSIHFIYIVLLRRFSYFKTVRRAREPPGPAAAAVVWEISTVGCMTFGARFSRCRFTARTTVRFS